VRRQHAEELQDPRAFARFLCGVSSPWLLRAKLQNDPLFGVLADVPFALVMERAKQV
jgi:ATP-dependent DNA helicase RecQ